MMITSSRKDKRLGLQRPKTSCNLLFLNCQRSAKVIRGIKTQVKVQLHFLLPQNLATLEVFRPLTIVRSILHKLSIEQLLTLQVRLSKTKSFKQPLITCRKYMNQVELDRFNNRTLLLTLISNLPIGHLIPSNLTVSRLLCRESIAKRSNS